MAVELLFNSKTPYKRRGNEIIYKTCPLCGNSKFNTQVNIAKGIWHCWACDRGGRLRGLSVLASEFGVQVEDPIEGNIPVLIIPDTARPIWMSDKGRGYLMSRNVTEGEGRRFSILYDDETDQLFVPYFEGQELIAFNVRTKEGKWVFNGTAKETLFYYIAGKTDDVVLCEGIFDGIKLARMQHNIFVLFGRIMHDNQMDRLLQMFNKFILALDRDKPGQVSTVKLAQRLTDRNAKVAMIKPPENKKDFGESSDQEVAQAFSNVVTVGFAELLKLRMQLAK